MYGRSGTNYQIPRVRRLCALLLSRKKYVN